MATSTDETIKTGDLKSQLEAIAGHEIDANTEQLAESIINLNVAVSSYSYTLPDALQDDVGHLIPIGDGIGHVVTKNIIIARPPVCTTPRLLDISVVGSTLASENNVFSINNFLCPTEGALVYNEPVNVVATPISGHPFFLTVTYSLVHTPPFPFATNLQVTVFAWDANGAPAPNVPIHFRCRVPAGILIV